MNYNGLTLIPSHLKEKTVMESEEHRYKILQSQPNLKSETRFQGQANKHANSCSVSGIESLNENCMPGSNQPWFTKVGVGWWWKHSLLGQNLEDVDKDKGINYTGIPS